MSRHVQLVLVVLFVLTTGLLFSQEKEEETGTANSDFIDYKKRKDWRFTISPYAWLASNSTDVGTEHLRQSFNDLKNFTNFGFQVAGKINYKKWGLSSNLTYAELGDGIKDGPILIDLAINQVILDTKLGYLIFDKVEIGDDIIEGWSMEASIGLIYWLNDINVDIEIPIVDFPPISRDISDKQEWFDLVVGVNTKLILSKSVLLGISANGGGFGIGESSNYYYDFNFINTFKVLKFMTVTAGYRTFKYSRVDGEGVDELKTTVKVTGPLLGVSFHL